MKWIKFEKGISFPENTDECFVTLQNRYVTTARYIYGIWYHYGNSGKTILNEDNTVIAFMEKPEPYIE